MFKLNRLILLAAFFWGAACNNGEKTGTVTQTSESTGEQRPADQVPVEPRPEEPAPAGISGCYMQVMGRDTFAAKLQQSGNTITGKLSFDNYQKDGSTGTISGKYEDGIIKVLYSFASEGMNSVMQIYYKLENGNLVRGIGDMNPRGDTAYYANPAAIRYEGSGLQKIDCDRLPGKYK